MERTTNVVVSRYKRNVDFVYKINDGKNTKFFIYEKESPEFPFNVHVNKGNECSVYLKYISDFYDNLAEYNFFIHDEEFYWHHSGSIIEKFDEAVQSNEKYYNINDECVNCINDAINCCNNNEWTDDFMAWYKEFIEHYVPFNELDIYQLNRNSSQFYVHKSIIRCLPRSFYMRLYEWIIDTPFEDAKSGRFLEWTWHILWKIYPERILR